MDKKEKPSAPAVVRAVAVDDTNPVAPPQTQPDINPADIENNTGGASVEESQNQLQIQIGETGTMVTQGVLSNVDYNFDLTGTKRISEFDKMKLGDGTVRAALSAVKLPLKSANWYIKPPKDKDDTDEDTVFIKEQLLENDNFSWLQLLNKVLTFVEYGNSIFEKVFYPMPNGKVGWRKFGHRLSKTIYRWTFQDGKTPGITQMLATSVGAPIREIPKWKLLYFINELEGSNYEGISFLRAAYKHWVYKDLYYRIDVMASEKHGLGTPIIHHPPTAKPQDIAKAREIARNMRSNPMAYMDLPNGFTIDMLDQKAHTLKDPKEMIAHHNREIVLSFLAEFLDLGADGAGSYALSSDKSDFFMLSLESIAKTIQEPFNQAIKELIILNKGPQESYPTLEYSGIGKADLQKLATALNSLSSAGFIHPDEATETHLREEFNLPEAEEGAWYFEKEMDQKMLESFDQPLVGAGGGKPGDKSVDNSGGKGKPPIANPKPGQKPIPPKRPQRAQQFMEDVIELREEVERVINAKE